MGCIGSSAMPELSSTWLNMDSQGLGQKPLETLVNPLVDPCVIIYGLDLSPYCPPRGLLWTEWAPAGTDGQKQATRRLDFQ